jgi:hypothetical protein
MLYFEICQLCLCFVSSFQMYLHFNHSPSSQPFCMSALLKWTPCSVCISTKYIFKDAVHLQDLNNNENLNHKYNSLTPKWAHSYTEYAIFTSWNVALFSHDSHLLPYHYSFVFLYIVWHVLLLVQSTDNVIGIKVAVGILNVPHVWLCK